MAKRRRNQEHLGIDTNVLVAYLDSEHPSHRATEGLQDQAVALGPTVVHEAYHTLVFKMRWRKEDAAKALLDAIRDEGNRFINQTLRITKVGLDLAVDHDLGGRDSLILANLLVSGIRHLVTFDKTLMGLKEVTYGESSLKIGPP